jgi:predicted transcriptional regulator
MIETNLKAMIAILREIKQSNLPMELEDVDRVVFFGMASVNLLRQGLNDLREMGLLSRNSNLQYSITDRGMAFLEKENPSASYHPSSYDVMPFSDGNGELYLGTTRSASYKHDPYAGRVAINLSEKLHGKESLIEGYSIQSDKARDVCRVWVEEGRISTQFNRISR